MTDTQLQHNWTALKGKLKQKYGQLTDDDVTFVEGKGEELMARLRQKLGLSDEELTTVLEDLKSSAEGKVEKIKAMASEGLDQAKAKAADVVEDLKHKATAIGEEAKAQGTAAYDEARQRARSLWEDGKEYVRANPRQSILTAVAVGFVTGLIVLRR